MKKQLLLICVAILGTLGATAATNYGINVGGVEVTSSNYSNITGGDIKTAGGKVTYDPTTKVLTLSWVSISRGGSNDRAIHNRSCDGLTIVIDGTSDFSCSGCSTFKLERTTYLQVNGTNSCNIRCTSSGDDAIWITHNSSTTLVIQGKGNVNLTSTGGEGIAGSNNEHVMLRSGNININAKRGAFSDLNSVQFTPDNNSTTSRGITCGMLVKIQPTGSSSYAHARNVGTISAASGVSVKAPTYGGSVTMLSSSSNYSKEFVISNEANSSSYNVVGNFLYDNSATLVGPTVTTKYNMPTTLNIPGYAYVGGSYKNVTIGSSAFANLTGFSSLVINYGVKAIYNRAFMYCSTLSTIRIPSSVTRINEYAFYGTAASSVYWSTLYPNNATIGTDIMPSGRSVTLNLPTREARARAENNATLNSMFVLNDTPNSYDFKLGNASFVVTSEGTSTTNGKMALTGWSGANTINLTDGDAALKYSNSSFGNNAMYYCREVAPWAFYSYTNLTAANLTADFLESIGDYAFHNASSLKSVAVGRSVRTIGENAFIGTALESIEWGPRTFTDFTNSPRSPFYKLRSQIKTLTFGPYVVDIPAYLGYEFTNVTSLSLPSSLKTIGHDAFYRMGITSLTIPYTVQTIGTYAFSTCSKLSTVTIGSAVTSLAGSAFYGCSNIKTLNWNATSHSDFSASPFAAAANSINTVTFGGSVNKVPAYLCHNFSNLTSISLPGTIKTIGAHGFEGSGLRSLNTASVQTISESAFAYCGDLATVTLGSELKTLGKDAFNHDVALKSVTLPASLTSMGTGVFSNCTALASVTDNSRLTYIPDYTFQNCTALKQFNIRDGVTTVGKWAFMGGGLTELEIPQSVTNIGEMAFGSSSLQQITSWPRSEDVTLGATVFYLVNKQTCKLHVKPSCLAKYQTADQWKDFFFNIIGDLEDPDYNPNKFDVNNDDTVDVGDVNAVLAAILAGSKDDKFNVNGDTGVDVGDVNAILEHILTK